MSGEPSGSGSGALSNFWQRSTDRLNPKKFKFVSTAARTENNANDAADSASVALTAKQRRRTQVRKAQIEHRQRKANYVKHLEQDVIDLREMITAAELEAILTQQENEGIRNAMLSAQIPVPIVSAVVQMPTAQSTSSAFQPDVSLSHLSVPVQGLNNSTTALSQSATMDELGWLSRGSGSSIINTVFDEMLSQTVLKISLPPGSNTGTGARPSPRSGNSPHVRSRSGASFGYGRSPSAGPPRHRRGASLQLVSKEEVDVSTFAVNFILALEHPCRTHFHASSEDFDPSGDPSGHELLASTLLYNNAPTPVFPTLSAAVPVPTWTIPSSSASTIQKLEEMSRSLPKQDWEVTPVQAWFLMVDRYGIEKIVNGNGVEKIRQGLAKLVECFAFGAVMDTNRFWEVVQNAIGDDFGGTDNGDGFGGAI